MKKIHIGILLYMLAWTFIPIMDGLAKYLSSSLPVMQIVWSRYFFSCLLVIPFVLVIHKKKSFKSDNYSLQILRGSFLVITTVCFFYSISIIPLAFYISTTFSFSQSLQLACENAMEHKHTLRSLRSCVPCVLRSVRSCVPCVLRSVRSCVVRRPPDRFGNRELIKHQM